MNFLFKINFKKSLIVFVCFLIVALFIIFAYYSYPVPAGDSIFYLAPAVQFAAKGTLISPLYPSEWIMDKVVDPLGMKRFLYYPPLFPIVLSYLMPEATPQGIFVAIAILNIVVISLSALLFYKIATRKTVLSWSGVFLIVVALLALVASLAETGRPEVLARLWVVLGTLVPFYISKKYDWIFYSTFLGLMFATHPAGGIFSILILGIVLGARYAFKDFTLRGGAILFVSSFVSLSAITLGPFGIGETLGGIFRHAIAVTQVTQKFLTFSNIFNYFIVSPTAPFYGLIVLLVLIAGIYFYRKYRDHLVSPRFVFLCAALLVFLLGKAILLGHAFYPSLFTPLSFSILIYFFLEKGILQKVAIIVTFMLVVTGIMRTTILFPFFIRQDSTLEQARTHFAELIRPYLGSNAKIAVTGGFWSLTENYKNVYPYNTWPEKPKENTALVFFQQRYSSMLNPPEIAGCSLISDKFSREIPKVFGVKLANTMPDYGYAVYNCLKKL